MKRIFYNDAGEVISVDIPSSKYLGGHFIIDKTKPIKRKINLNGKEIEVDDFEMKELTIEDCKIPENLKQYKFFVTTNDLPDHEYTNQMIIENDSKITVDQDKTKTLMPVKFIKAKYLAKKTQALSEELTKEAPDAIAVVTLNADIQLSKEQSDESFWLQKAIEGLDEKVAKGEGDKPLIRQKLQEKINAS